MKTLQEILNKYNSGIITLKEMQNEVNLIGSYRGYCAMHGNRYLRAIIENEFIEVKCNC